MLPLETLPPGEPSGGVVYLWIVLSPEQASRLWMFLNISVLQWGVVSTSPNPPSWRTSPRWLSATAYSIYSQLPSLSEAVPLSATWGRAMPWWQGPTTWTFSVKLSDFTCDVIPDGKTEKTAQFWQAIAQASELSFPVVFQHRELRSSLRESHSFLSLLADTTTASSQGTQFIQQMSIAWYIPFQIPVLTLHSTLSFLLLG